MANTNGDEDAPLMPKEKKSLHIEQVEKGLLPADSPEDFVIPDGEVNDSGLPWWFPPDFTPAELSRH